jgi:hypothetical protein
VVKRLLVGALWSLGGINLLRRRNSGRIACYAAAVINVGHNLFVNFQVHVMRAEPIEMNDLLYWAAFNGPPLIIVCYLALGPQSFRSVGW